MTSRPDGLAERGSDLWDALAAERDWDAAGLVLIGEACRLVDRLEQLDQLLRADIGTWARIEENYAGRGRTIELVVDGPLTEARQMQTALAQLMTKLGLGKSEAKSARTASKSDDLRARRAARVAAATHLERPAGSQ